MQDRVLIATYLVVKTEASFSDMQFPTKITLITGKGINNNLLFLPDLLYKMRALDSAHIAITIDGASNAPKEPAVAAAMVIDAIQGN